MADNVSYNGHIQTHPVFVEIAFLKTLVSGFLSTGDHTIKNGI